MEKQTTQPGSDELHQGCKIPQFRSWEIHICRQRGTIQRREKIC